MKICDAFIVLALTPFVLLSGCSVFSDSDKKSDANIAYSVAPEVASKGSSARKKPTQPKTLQDDIVLGETSSLEGDYITYTVQRGDTIYAIARKFDVSPATVMSLNGLEKNSKLMVGQKLTIESSKKITKQCAVIGESTVYTVVRGDSLCRIARQYGISLNALREANSLSSDRLVIGQKINIPPCDTSAKHTGAECCVSIESGAYTVRQGDSLCIIAKKLGVKQADLQRVNNISNPNRLRVGQKLIIPDKNAVQTSEKIAGKVSSAETKKVAMKDSGDLYTIRSGDTIESVAAELGVSKADLIELNNLSEASTLQQGKKLLIPQRKSVVLKETAEATQAKPTNEDFFDSFEEIPVVEINN